jgi:hypothetical protein
VFNREMDKGSLVYVEWVDRITCLDIELFNAHRKLFEITKIFFEIIFLGKGYLTVRWYNPTKKHTRVKLRTLTTSDDVKHVREELLAKIDSCELRELFKNSDDRPLKEFIKSIGIEVG